LIVQLRAQWG